MKKEPHVLYIEGWSSKSGLFYLSATLQGPDTKNLSLSAAFSVLRFPQQHDNQNQMATAFIIVAVVLATFAAAGAAFVAYSLGKSILLACVPGMPAIYMQMTLNMNLQDIQNLERFKTQLVSGIVKSLNLSTWQVQILSIRPGSVIVDFVLRSHLNKQHVIENGAKNLREQLHDPSSMLMRGRFTCSAVAIEQLPDPPSVQSPRPFKFDPSKEEAHAVTTKSMFPKSSMENLKTRTKGC